MIKNNDTDLRSGTNTQLWRPLFHFTPPSGWMNDPNGLIYYKGKHHLFYQYNPYGCEWASMHWGHAISDDMLSWEDLPIALKPDEPYDNHPEGGCFSGSAIEKDGILYLFYTGSIKEDGKTKQTQCIAYSNDGVKFTKYEKNPVITAPFEGGYGDFRDPKVFAANDKYYMVVGGSVGGADTGGDGRVYLYESLDLFEWQYRGEIFASNGKLGTMFECPDLFQIGDKWVLTTSPMNHPEYNKALYALGTMDFDAAKFNVETIGCLDYGYDFYAPQSFTDAKGKRVTIGWLNGWTWMPWHHGFGPTDKENWRGKLSIPREVSLIDGKVSLLPTKNIESLYADSKVYEGFDVSQNRQTIDIKTPKSYCLNLSLKKDRITDKLTIVLMGAKKDYVWVDVDVKGKKLYLKKDDEDGQGETCVDLSEDREISNISFYVDKSGVEVFAEEGTINLTMNVYPSEEDTNCSIYGVSDSTIDRLTVHSIVSE